MIPRSSNSRSFARLIERIFGVIKTQGGQKGYTVVELLVALVVAAILTGAVTQVISAQAHLSQRGRDLAVTTSFVENKVESLRSLGYLSLVDGTTDITAQLPAELKAPRSGSLQISTYALAVKKILISITYNDQGTTRTYTYATLIGELGVGQY